MNTEILLEEVVCALPGGTQSLAVKDVMGNLYTLKRPENPQGPNVLANEWLGSQIMTVLGLHSPRVHPVVIPAGFLGAGTTNFFGLVSEFIESRCERLCFEFLPRELAPKLANADHFIGALVLDTWVGSTDRRQALYVEAPGSWFTAVFIDHGQLFGGPDWQFKGRPGTSRSMQTWVYDPILDENLLSFWIGEIRTKVLHMLPKILCEVPKSWYSGDIVVLGQILMDRAACLEQLVKDELRSFKERERSREIFSSRSARLIYSGSEAFQPKV